MTLIVELQGLLLWLLPEDKFQSPGVINTNDLMKRVNFLGSSINHTPTKSTKPPLEITAIYKL